MLCYTLPRKNYTKDKQGKVTRQYQKIWKKENFGYMPGHKDTVVCEEHWPADYPKVIYYGKERPRDSPLPFFLCVKIAMLGT